ncbi:MAG: FxDxF family PEP-CTERM protein [Burkholderiales bacterium]
MGQLKKFAVVLAASMGCMGVAQAATFEAGALSPSIFENTAIFPSSTPLAFEDIYSFTIADFQTLLASATSTTTTPEGTTIEQAHISNLSLSLFASVDGSSLGSVSAGSGNQVDLSQNLVAGDYFLKVSGVTDGSLGGAYQFSIAAVPEPGEWMMLLAGLAVLGFIAKRKTSGLMAG